MDNVQSERAQQRGRRRLDSSALEKHLASGRTVDACEDLDSGRFARAVLAEKRVEAPAVRFQADLAQREGCAEGLGDVAQLEKRRAV